jgi:hypothetical protein
MPETPTVPLQTPRRTRPSLEALEDRAVPAALGSPAQAELFIASLYKDLLGRAATGAEVAGWQALDLDAAGLVRAFLGSQEYREGFVTTCYARFLERAPDAAGLAFWADALARGTSEEQVAVAFLSSPEFLAAQGGTDEGFVRGLYAHVLRRTPEPGGPSHWLAALREPGAHARVAADFVFGAEYRGKEIARYYKGYLARGPEPGGVQSWLAAGGAGQVRQGLLTSDEYFAGLGQGRVLNQNALAYQVPDEVPVLQRLGLFDPSTQTFGTVAAGSLPDGKNVYFMAHGWAPGFKEMVEKNSTPGDPLKWWETTDTSLPGSPGEPDSAFMFEETVVPAGVFQPRIVVSPVGLAKAITEVDPNAVVVAYSWIDESATDDYLGSIPAGAYLSEAHTDLNGHRLANAVRQALPAGFTGKLHLLGHSHGSKVAATATLALQQAGQPVAHLTLLDSPESELTELGDAANYNWFILQQLDISRTPLTTPGTTFVDNYASEFGTRFGTFEGLGEVVDVTLNPQLYSAIDVGDRHSYAAPWYSGTSLDTTFGGNVNGLAWSPLLAPATAPTLAAAYTQSWSSSQVDEAHQFTLGVTQQDPEPPTTEVDFTSLTITQEGSSGSVAFDGTTVTLSETGSSASFSGNFDTGFSLKGIAFDYRFTQPGDGDQLTILVDDDLYFVMTGSQVGSLPLQGTLSVGSLFPDPIFGHSLTVALQSAGGNGNASVSVGNFRQFSIATG